MKLQVGGPENETSSTRRVLAFSRETTCCDGVRISSWTSRIASASFCSWSSIPPPTLVHDWAVASAFSSSSSWHLEDMDTFIKVDVSEYVPASELRSRGWQRKQHRQLNVDVHNCSAFGRDFDWLLELGACHWPSWQEPSPSRLTLEIFKRPSHTRNFYAPAVARPRQGTMTVDHKDETALTTLCWGKLRQTLPCLAKNLWVSEMKGKTKEIEDRVVGPAQEPAQIHTVGRMSLSGLGRFAFIASVRTALARG